MPEGFTEDTLFKGGLRLFQPPRGEGYRFTVDSVLLARFAAEGGGVDAAVDLGAGCGVVGLALLRLGAARRVVLVERDALLARACALGIEANGFAARAGVIVADVRERGWRGGAGKARLVVANPPYHRRGTGRLPGVEEVARARHELTMTVGDAIGCGAALLGRGGRIVLVMPPGRLADALAHAASLGLRPLRLRFVHPKLDREAGSVLVDLRRSSGKRTQARVLPPLVVHAPGGAYTPEAAAMIDDARAASSGDVVRPARP